MRAIVQRVVSARVEVDGERVGAIGRGLCAFIGAGKQDEARDLSYMADKIAGLRVFNDPQGRMNLSVDQVGGEVLAVSQFTVYGDVRRGRRPSFAAAMAPEPARAAFDGLVELLRGRGLRVQTGRFAAHMRVLVDNDGPVTILLDSHKQF